MRAVTNLSGDKGGAEGINDPYGGRGPTFFTAVVA